jgi:hypothetical protein
MKPGLYRNELGAELHVQGLSPRIGLFLSLGDTYEAVARDSLFGNTWYVVTEKSMAESGYQLVEEAGE